MPKWNLQTVLILLILKTTTCKARIKINNIKLELIIAFLKKK